MGATNIDMLSLPTGGGAVRGLGQTFQPDLHHGTGNYTIPLEFPAGRAQMAPQLSLSYSSGNPTGVFGFGWRLSIPSVRRRTDKHIPRYGADDAFVLGDAEQLVPVHVDGSAHQRFRPRTDNLHARIEHRDDESGDYWEVWTPEGLRSYYGTPRPPDADDAWRDPATVTDPEHPARILTWMLTRTENTFGDALDYAYTAGDDDGGAQRYLDRIGYVSIGDGGHRDHFVQIRFSYESRPDVHMDRRGGFLVATSQRCRRIETWTGPGQSKELVRSVTLTYSDAETRTRDNGASLLTSVSVTGHDVAESQTLPSLSFGYSAWEPSSRRLVPLEVAGGASRVPSLTQGGIDLIDLRGDGIPDMVQLSSHATRYWRNEGAGTFERPVSLRTVPAGVTLGTPGTRLIDADGDGRPDVLVIDGTSAGYYPLTDGSVPGARGYFPYSAAPSLALTDEQLKLLDLDGDGITDALRTGERLQGYLNNPPDGWQAQPSRTYPGSTAFSFADPRIQLADMTGDGLQDVVLLHDRRVTYWPNEGFGAFGDPVVMRNSPQFGEWQEPGSPGFDPARLLLGDLDGDGCADIAYVGTGSTTIWVNQSGGSFAEPVDVPGTPRLQGGMVVRLADLVGSGMSGVLWSRDAGGGQRPGSHFLDLTGGTKPYLLTHVDNHMGGTATVTYAPSTRYALADAAEGRPWRTSCPVPVHVVASVVSADVYSRSETTTVYSYHHGYWDGADREFRGFGRVDQQDASTIDDGPTDAAQHYSPPTLQRTWFHQGPVGSRDDWVELDLSDEHWAEDSAMLGGGDRSAVPPQLSRRQWREALRALRGRVLRSELYAQDDTADAERPYTVSELAYSLHPVFESGSEPYEAWLTNPVFRFRQEASRVTQWERGVEPRTRIELSSGEDRYGNARYSATLAVPRGRDPVVEAADDRQFLTTVTEIEYAVRDDADHYLCDRPCLQHVSEVLDDEGRSLDQMRKALFEPATLPKRTLEFARMFYDGEPFTGLPAGRLGDHGLPVAVRTLGLTRGQLREAWGNEPLPPYLEGADTAPATGLIGSYFRGSDLQDLTFVRPDRAIDFTWTGGPDPSLARKDFSVRWEGVLHPESSETFTFDARYAGRLRVWLDDQLVLDAWDGNGALSGEAALAAGVPVSLRVEYAARDWNANVRLEWSSPTTPATVLGSPWVATPDGTAAAPWPDEYPDDFSAQVPAGAGYQYECGGDGLYEPGYYTHAGTRYDVHDDPGTAHGLTIGRRDPSGVVSTVEYDDLALLPVATVDAAGLRREGSYEYRQFRLVELTDVNGNRSRVGYTPLGLTAWTAAMGPPGTELGDIASRPGTRYVYGLDEQDAADPDLPSPLWVRTEKVVDHYWAIVGKENQRRQADGDPPLSEAEIEALFPPDEAARYQDRFLCSVAFNDGSGRTLQVRTQAEEVTVDDLGLAADGSPAQPLLLTGGGPSSPRVVVSGQQAYDNKGRVVMTWEPVFSTGWAYEPRYTVPTGLPTQTFYDARGEVVLTRHPDGSEERAVRGLLVDLHAPDGALPSPWEASLYDSNDNAGRTHPASATYPTHWDTPSTSVFDALGRTIEKVERMPGLELVTRHQHDARDRLVRVTDPAGRTAVRRTYDMQGHVWRSELLDAGTERIVYDARGAAVEHRDAKGGLLLVLHDRLGRSVCTWARDSGAEPVTLRQVDVYGDSPDAGLPPAEAAAKNLRLHLYRTFDEAGLLTCESYDFDGRVERTRRQVLSSEALLSGIPDASGDWRRAAYTVDWARNGKTPDEVATEVLDPSFYDVDETWNALGHRTELTTPADARGARRVIRTGYSAAATPIIVSVDDQPVLLLAVHNARGQRVAELTANSVLTRYAYDPTMPRLVRQHSQVVKAVDGGWRPAGPSLADQLRTYDLMGNVLTVSERSPGSGVGASPDRLDRTFTYDALYRVLTATGREHLPAPPAVWSAAPRGSDVSASQPYDEKYAYDLSGNLVSIIHHTGSAGYTRQLAVDAESNRITSLTVGGSVFDYHYDGCGNQISEADSRNFCWNAGNRLTSFFVQAGSSDPSVFAQYRYDASGARVLKLVRKPGGILERVVYVGGLERLVVDNGTDHHVYDELHVGTEHSRLMVWRLADRQPDDQRPARCFDLADSLNSSILLVDEVGAIVNREEYSPFGATVFGGCARKRYRFSGRERDEESGLCHHGARYYAPWSARWISTDPKGVEDGLNLYAYARGNPVVLSDPAGTQTPAPDPRQMELVESIKFTATANRTFIAHAEQYTKALKALCHQWMLDAKQYALGHDKSTPHYRNPGGSTVFLGPQSRWANAMQSVGERAARALDRAQGLWGRTGRTDPGAARGTRFPGSLDPEVAKLATSDIAAEQAGRLTWASRHDQITLLGKEGLAKLEAAGAKASLAAAENAGSGLSKLNSVRGLATKALFAVGVYFTARNMHAAYQRGALPFAAQGLREGASLGGGFVGGLLLGAALGVEAGPGLIVTSLVGGFLGSSMGQAATEPVIQGVKSIGPGFDAFIKPMINPSAPSPWRW
jgi:RHS repeat-associated protein